MRCGVTHPCGVNFMARIDGCERLKRQAHLPAGAIHMDDQDTPTARPDDPARRFVRRPRTKDDPAATAMAVAHG